MHDNKSKTSRPLMDPEIGESKDEALRLAIAEDNDFLLYRHYRETEAAKFIRLHPVTLKKIRLAGKIGFVRTGNRSIAYFGYQLADFLISNIETGPTVDPGAKVTSSSPHSHG